MFRFFSVAAVSLLITLSLTAQEQIGSDLLGFEADEQYGYSVQLSGDARLVVIGGPFSDDGTGSMRVFADIFNEWSFQWGITGIEGGASGLAVDISDDGNMVAIGSPGTIQGQVNVFEKVGIDYSSIGPGFVGPDELANLFGSAISLSGDGKRVAVGARSFDGVGDDVGYVEVFEFIDNEWRTIGSPLDSPLPFGEMGRSLDLSYDGSIMAIGIPTTPDNTGEGQVQVYKFEDIGDWELMGEPIVGGLDLTGYSVAISGDGMRIAVGAPAGAGKVQVFEYQDDGWQQLGGPMSINSSRVSGFSTDISSDGNRVIVGALGSNSSSTPGAVGVYDFDGTTWSSPFQEITGLVGEAFGWSVSLSADGETFAVGAPGNDDGNNDQGKVEIYEIGPTSVSILDAEAANLSVFPNPTRGLLNIKGPDLDRQRLARVISASGQTVYASYLRAEQMDISQLPSGVYHVLIPHGSSDYVLHKVVKNDSPN
ncbi:MAG: T9SS type A sorting domain-containing protein [Saprospiraceae bacterium]|nr:T9SS type A sorting domain-containing protein [Saprospiraceae bacterium]